MALATLLALGGAGFTLWGLARTLATWRFSAFETAVAQPTRIAATLEPPDPIFATLTNDAQDSVPQGLEPRPARAAAAPREPERTLGDLKPKPPPAKRQKREVRAKARLSTIGLGKPRQTLMAGEAPNFDGGGSGAFASEEPPTSTGRGDSPQPAAAAASERPARGLRSVSPRGGAAAVSPRQTHLPPAYEGDAAEEPETE